METVDWPAAWAAQTVTVAPLEGRVREGVAKEERMLLVQPAEVVKAAPPVVSHTMSPEAPGRESLRDSPGV
jgi:hypothetical protein